MKRILFLTARVPAPLDDGWKIRTFHLIKGFVQEGWQVDLLSFRGPEQQASDFPELERMCKRMLLIVRAKAYAPKDLLLGLFTPMPFHVYNYRIPAMAAAVEEMTATTNYDFIQVEDVVMAQYAAKAGSRGGRILDMHNVESSLLDRFAVNEPNPLKRMYARITARKLRRYERRVASLFHRILVCSPEDGRLLGNNGLQTPVQVIPNGVDCDYFHPQPWDPSAQDLVFVGSMDYHANISGVLYFVQNILPLVWRINPRTRLTIVGKNPPEAILRLAEERITITGRVADVRPFLARARVVVVPLLVGGGTRLKILEAMASARAIVATPLGAEGLAIKDGEHLFLAEKVDDFASKTCLLLENAELCRSLGESASAFARSNYDWSSITTRLRRDLPPLPGES
ncbi:sugar transferase, PEP-CTERM/EpsH1 system associated [Desulfonatronum thiosulfatophilum]|uniref:Sugar transferase, PEP-CTERM/EpsH1 system associated n=1 Tax=Desulfonatronum thiosulfatophilum TaxID=617002 RepID=A0A1G6EKT1_9BACT|nr:glycosyltransferase [Desulfonatronum thiosulfatophilum]SDB58081.1 sugar transferase, PEP-CTERM/EpsH1 system associated [Desulfonatronum thiosulfatophilum]